MNKNDLRYKTTEKLICDAYIKLSNESEDKKITVTDLVKEAQINRGTFYLHYQNVDDVCKDISDKFLTKCIEILSSDGELNLKKERIESILKYLKNNKNYVNFIIQDKFKTFIADSIVEYVTKEFVKKFSQILNFKEDEVKPVVIYMVYGSVALVVDWAKNDYEGSLSQIADALRITNGLAIKNFFLK